MKDEINIFKVLDFMRDHAPLYAKAKAELLYLEEYRKTLKSEFFFEALEHGHTTMAEREAYAYKHPKYKAHLAAIREASEIAENLRWLLVAAQAKGDAWRSMEASNRALDRAAA